MMAARTAGFSWYQSASSCLVTVMKSLPRKTPATCGSANSRSASGERRAAARSGKLAVPFFTTTRPGRNFSVAGFGVCSVWKKMARFSLALAAPNQPQRVSRSQQAADVLNLPQDRLGDRARALGAAAQDRVDMAGIGHQAPHLAADAAENLDRQIAQGLLEA